MDKKKQAINLRKNGYSLSYISNKVDAAKSTISLWVRDIQLSKEQKATLNTRPHLEIHRKNFRTKWKNKKEKWQQEGFLRAKEHNPLHILGCSIYWGEGGKTRNNCFITNSDPKMLKCFLNFVYKEFNLNNNNIKILISCYDDLHSVNEIEQFWLESLGFSKENMYKTSLNNRPTSSKKKRSKLEYGTCSLKVLKGSRVLEHIKGAIKYYQSFGEPVRN